jgi:hypothetical protein
MDADSVQVPQEMVGVSFGSEGEEARPLHSMYGTPTDVRFKWYDTSTTRFLPCHRQAAVVNYPQFQSACLHPLLVVQSLNLPLDMHDQDSKVPFLQHRVIDALSRVRLYQEPFRE